MKNGPALRSFASGVSDPPPESPSLTPSPAALAPTVLQPRPLPPSPLPPLIAVGAGALLVGGALQLAVSLRWQPALTQACRHTLIATSGVAPDRVALGDVELAGDHLQLDDVRIGALRVAHARLGVEWGALLTGRHHPFGVTLEEISTPLGDTNVAALTVDLANRTLHITNVHARLLGAPLGAESIDVAPSLSMTIGNGSWGTLDGWAGLIDRTSSTNGGVWHARLARERATFELTWQHDQLHAQLRFETLGHLPPLTAMVDLTDAHLDGTVQIDGTARALTIIPRLTLDEAAIDMPALSPVRLTHLHAALTGGTIALLPLDQAVTAQALAIEWGALHFTVGGTLRKSRVELDATLPATPCQEILRALPPALVPTLDGLAVDGTLAMRAQTLVDWDHPDETRFAPTLDVGCHVTSDPPLADVHALLKPFTRPAAVAPGAHPLLLGPANPDFRALATLPANVVKPFVESEDGRFFAHHGFDAAMIERALGMDVAANGFHHGASTISQQLVKNAFLTGQRTLARKLEEAVLTWRLEQVVPKPRILELYLNLIELGPDIYGITQGAEHYFGKEPEELSIEEAAQLAALLPAPRHGQDAAWKARYEALKARLTRAGILPRP